MMINHLKKSNISQYIMQIKILIQIAKYILAHLQNIKKR